MVYIFNLDADKARKHGMEDYISADPCTFDHANLFKTLQNLTLEYRLNDPYASLVSVLSGFDALDEGISETCIFICRINRDGLVQDKYLFWTNIAHDTVCEDAIDIYVIFPTFWTVLKNII